MLWGLMRQKLCKETRKGHCYSEIPNAKLVFYLKKSRNRWIREGDANTSFFHKYINKRRKCNETTRINIDGVWREEVAEVKKDIFEFFKNHFSMKRLDKPRIGLNFA
ncbi:hypothetical protein ACS0TY_027578 [Phlomoides rotata]